MLLDKILNELKLSLSGLTEENEYIKIGKIINADAIIWGQINMINKPYHRECIVNLKIIDVREGVVFFTTVYKEKDIWGGWGVLNLDEAATEISQKILALLKQ
jgi:hypothetical protein